MNYWVYVGACAILSFVLAFPVWQMMFIVLPVAFLNLVVGVRHPMKTLLGSRWFAGQTLVWVKIGYPALFVVMSAMIGFHERSS